MKEIIGKKVSIKEVIVLVLYLLVCLVCCGCAHYDSTVLYYEGEKKVLIAESKKYGIPVIYNEEDSSVAYAVLDEVDKLHKQIKEKFFPDVDTHYTIVIKSSNKALRLSSKRFYNNEGLVAFFNKRTKVISLSAETTCRGVLAREIIHAFLYHAGRKFKTEQAEESTVEAIASKMYIWGEWAGCK